MVGVCLNISERFLFFYIVFLWFGRARELDDLHMQRFPEWSLRDHGYRSYIEEFCIQARYPVQMQRSRARGKEAGEDGAQRACWPLHR